MRRTSPFVLLVLAACSSASTVGGLSGGAADGSAGAGGGRPVPSAPPAQAVGVASLGRLQAGTGAATTQGNAMFLSPATDLSGSSFQDMFSGYIAVPIDACVSLPTFSTSGGGQQNPLDAGQVGFVDEDGTAYALPALIPGFPVYQAKLPDAAFRPLSRYRLVATGGAVPAFEGAFWTPGPLTVTAPGATGALVVDRAQPLTIRWSGAPDGDPLIVQLAQADTKVTCRVRDDGEFTVPSATLQAFADSASIDRSGGGAATDTMTVERVAWYPVGAGATATLVIATSGASFDLDLR